MAFPSAVPTDRTEHKEQGENFVVENGRWSRQPNSLNVITYRMGANGYYWGRQALDHPLHHFLRLRGVLQIASRGHVAVNLYDGAKQPLGLTNGQAYAQEEWGDGGRQQLNWVNLRDFAGDKGITLNPAISAAMLGPDTPQEVECEIYRADANVTAMRSRIYYWTSSRSCHYVQVLAWWDRPIEDIKHVGLRTTSKDAVPVMRFIAEYW